MFPHKRIAGFAFRLLLFYGLLIAPWPGLRDGYSVLYRWAGNAIFGTFASGGTVRFHGLRDDPDGKDTEITIQNRWSPVVGRMPHSYRLSGYLPTVETIALILATPIPWSRRWKALGWGVILINVFVIFRVWITLLRGFSLDQPCALYHPSPFWQQALTQLYKFVAVSPTCSFLVPALIWILVSFRRTDWETWLRMDTHPEVQREKGRVGR